MPDVRARIVHLSDLHLSRRSNSGLLLQLRKIICEAKPHILAVTGDLVDNPWPWAMKQAADWLKETVSGCEHRPELFVVPGNHDYKLIGNFGLRRVTRIPFHYYFRLFAKERPRRWTALAQWCKLLLRSFWPWSSYFHDGLKQWDRQDLGLVLFGFNSTSLLQMWATGEVEFRDLNDLDSIFGQNAGFDDYYKIALVHHHPLPTRHRPVGRRDRLFDSFMVFYNAGHFLRRMCQHEFQLVLHGHHHFSNLTFYTGEHNGHRVAVASAGTASAPTTNDARGHHLHIIEIKDDDTASLHSRYYSDAESRLDATADCALSDLNTVREARNRALARKSGYVVGQIIKTVNITKDGYTEITIEQKNCVATRKDGVTSCRVEWEAPEPSYLRGCKVTSPPYAAFINEERTLRTFKADLDLGGSQQEFDTRCGCRLMNGHTLTRQEFQRKYGSVPREYEYASGTVSAPTEVLTLIVQYPDGFEGATPEIEVKYIPWHLRRKGVEDYDALPEHADERRRVEPYLNPESPTRAVFRCPRPIPDFVYRIRWKLKDERQPAALASEDFVRKRKRDLLEILSAAANADSEPLQRYGQISDALDRLSEDIGRLLQFQRPEKLEISLMVFEDESRRLRIVCANFGSVAELPKKSFASGEGCAGFAFEKARRVLFHPSRDPIGYYITPEEAGYGQAHAAPDQTVVALPWVYDRIVLGVVNIGSHQLSSLVRLFDLTPADQGRTLNELNSLTDDQAGAILVSEVF